MPTYDYACGACGHQFEHFQSMTSRRLRKCPSCGERKLERLVGSGAGLIFKGSGFYETDYKRAAGGGAAKAGGEDGASKKSESKSESKSEAKSETKTDAKAGGKSGGSGD
jgi:putative FmdB family regulatory protein